MFNIRVYGILIDAGLVLVTDEFRLGMLMTKFPGGGLEFGEGTLDCLKREWVEELGMEIEQAVHYYTTDFYQPSYHLPEKNQLISIYYLVKPKMPFQVTTTEQKFDFAELVDGVQSFRWMKLEDVQEDAFTFPIDKIVGKKIREDFLAGYLT
jgi:8-oxo-dGTP diphosphatase